MDFAPQLLLIAAVTGVGVLHTLVPDHWAPIALLARQRGWSRAETARAALTAGAGHVLSTLVIGALVWLAGVALAARFGEIVALASGLLLVAFGLWMATVAWLELHHRHAPANGHGTGAAQAAEEHLRGEAPLPRRRMAGRTGLLLILGSSPMLEGIPAFFAAGRYGPGLIGAMAVFFAASTVATYVLMCDFAMAGMQRLHIGALERYGEVLSGALIAAIGLVFTIWSVA